MEASEQKPNRQMRIAELEVRWHGHEANEGRHDSERNEQAEEIVACPPMMLMITFPQVGERR